MTSRHAHDDTLTLRMTKMRSGWQDKRVLSIPTALWPIHPEFLNEYIGVKGNPLCPYISPGKVMLWSILSREELLLSTIRLTLSAFDSILVVLIRRAQWIHWPQLIALSSHQARWDELATKCHPECQRRISRDGLAGAQDDIKLMEAMAMNCAATFHQEKRVFKHKISIEGGSVWKTRS